MKKGLFITFEGPDGCGKTSIINLLKEYYKDNKKILFTREPGGTVISEKIRDIILSTKNLEMSKRTEALLYAASRAQHVDEFIKPNLEKGKIIISDRFVLSSLAYQGGGRNLGIDSVKAINDFAIDNISPDFVFFFYVDPLTTLKRKSQRKDADRLELSGDDFHKRVYDTYIKLLDSMKYEKFLKKIDATKQMLEVFEDVKNILDKEMEKLSWKCL